MGNNHEKNFSKKQRKILVLGIEKSGKTSNQQKIVELIILMLLKLLLKV